MPLLNFETGNFNKGFQVTILMKLKIGNLEIK